MPGYEVSGGPILWWLLKSPAADILTNPPAGLKISGKWGQSKMWHGVKAKQIDLLTSRGTEHQTMTLYLSENGEEFLGYETNMNGKNGYLIYTHQKLIK
jgi:hypothetical protein